ncbi:MAG: amidase family protein, partial [Alphaproteobacteria bacterium]
MPPIDLADLSARGAAATADAIRSGQTTASAVTDHALALIAAAEPLGAFVSVMGDAARADAAAVDRDIAVGKAVGPLAGVPVAVKDIIDVAGLPTRAGSVTRDKLPPAAKDAFAVAKLRAAGAVVIAKSKTVEYAFGGWGTNVIAGTPVNPFDKAVHRVPGGSSSGSGVAVGAGLVPLAFGTDTGGSVRLPASWCG